MGHFVTEIQIQGHSQTTGLCINRGILNFIFMEILSFLSHFLLLFLNIFALLLKYIKLLLVTVLGKGKKIYHLFKIYTRLDFHTSHTVVVLLGLGSLWGTELYN